MNYQLKNSGIESKRMKFQPYNQNDVIQIKPQKRGKMNQGDIRELKSSKVNKNINQNLNKSKIEIVPLKGSNDHTHDFKKLNAYLKENRTLEDFMSRRERHKKRKRKRSLLSKKFYSLRKKKESDFESFWCGRRKFIKKAPINGKAMNGFNKPYKEERGVDGRFVEYYGEEVSEAQKYRNAQNSDNCALI